MQKSYVDRETQTDVSRSSSPLLTSPQTQKTASSMHGLDDPHLSPSLHTRSTKPAPYGSAMLSYRAPTTPPVANPIHLSRRVYKCAQVTSESRKSVNRVVSLPETEPLHSIKNVLESATTARVASMSERPKPDMSPQDASSQDCFELSSSTENSYPTEEDGLSFHRRSDPLASDIPCTPSPPSSPDSVMIIENSVHLPKSFLRHDTSLISHPSYDDDDDDDDGWVTWANSPPRPIPALHGPLSLPYARCPSGAEGTIIEGPDDLSRMIWGLGPDDVLPSHSRVASVNTQPAVPHKSMSNPPQSNLPPRLPKAQARTSQGFATPTQRSIPDVSTCPTLSMSEGDHSPVAVSHPAWETRRHLNDTYTRAALHNSILQANAAKADQMWNLVYGMHDNRTLKSFDQDLRAFDMERGLGLDWQPTNAQQNFGNSGTLRSSKRLANYPDVSAPAFVPGSQIPSYSHPRIFVEPRPNESPFPRRLSAIEIAHKYRQQKQQQQQQQENALPTPPSSTSSSQWSPYFNSYQDSPDLVAFLPPRLSVAQTQQQRYYVRNSPQQLSKSHYEHTERLASNLNTSFTTSTQTSTVTSPRLASPHSSALSESIAKFLKQRYEFSSPSLMSPPHPGPPPNSPLPPVPTRSAKYQYSTPMIPLSPTSPGTRVRSLSYQQPRSVPLARLVQRRLSSVPEEDTSSFAGQICSAPQSPSNTKSSASLQPPSSPQRQDQQHVHDLAVSQFPGNPSPDVDALAPQTKTWPDSDGVVGGGSGKMAGVQQVKVKLPGSLVKASGRPARVAHRVKAGKATTEVKEDSGGKKVAQDGESVKTSPNSRRKLRGKKTTKTALIV